MHLMDVLNVFGGLAIFIFGMNMMSDGLNKSAGERMKSILGLFTSNRFVAIVSGTVVTAVVQSSSATTTMVIGFVNAGLLTLVQSIGIIFGANIGTTVTAQLVAFDIEWLIMPAIMLGVGMSFIPRDKVRYASETIIGFGLLFLGMSLMSGALKGVSTNESFQAIFATFNCDPDLAGGVIPPLKVFGAITIGLVATCIIQSSSATSGIVIALGLSGVIDNIETAMALILGSNIGTTITAQIAALTANRLAKQAALAHTLFNVIGVLVLLVTFWIPCPGSDEALFFAVLGKLSVGGELPRQIANAHTLFNVCTTLVLIPFVPVLARICEHIIPVNLRRVGFQRLEPHLLDTPAIALTQSKHTLRHMLRKSWNMVDCALRTYNRNDAKNQLLAERLDQREKRVDELQYEITKYLEQIMRKKLTPAQTSVIPLLLHCTNDAERIGDHTAIIVELIRNFKSEAGNLSDAANQEFATLCDKLNDLANVAADLLLDQPSQMLIDQGYELDRELGALCRNYEANHVRRTGGLSEKPEVGLFYVEIISEIRKVGHHFGNVVERARAISVV